MELQQLITATERIKQMHEEVGFALSMLLGALKGTQVKQQRNNTETTSKQMSAVLLEEDTVRRYKNKTIKKRPDGRWWTRYYDSQGKQHSVYGRTADEVIKKLKLALKQDKVKEEAVYTLSKWLEKWMQLYKEGKLKPSTLEQMQRHQKDVGPIGDVRIDKLTGMEIQQFLNGIQHPRKKEHIYVMLKDALTKAFKAKLIAENPMDNIDAPKHKKKKSRALTHEEEVLFVQACKNSNQGDLLLTCLYQGLRLGEALALTYNDVDFEKRTINVNKAVDSLGNLTTTKTETSNRILPLFERTANVIQRTGKGILFTYPRKVYQNTMLRITKKLGLSGISIHSLRHTFATRCAEANVPAKVVQKWLGHSTLEMTLNVYTHVNNDFEKEVANKFDTYFDT